VLLAVLLTHSATRVTSMAPGLNGVRMAAEDTGEEPVSNEVMESQLKAATAAKLSEEEDENNLPHGPRVYNCCLMFLSSGVSGLTTSPSS